MKRWRLILPLLLCLCLTACGGDGGRAEESPSPSVLPAVSEPAEDESPAPTDDPAPAGSPAPSDAGAPSEQPASTDSPAPADSQSPAEESKQTEPPASDSPSTAPAASPEPQESELPQLTGVGMTKCEYTGPNGERMSYWLYAPEGARAGLPLIVYLHGGSGKGNDLELLTKESGLPQYLQDGLLRPDAYVLIPQLDSRYTGWANVKETLMKLIAQVRTECGIDGNRVSLTGHSMGGTGTWQVALAYPASFSAIAPLSGSVTASDINLRKLSALPVWAVVGEADTIVDPESSRQFIAALSQTSGRAYLTELEGAGHFDVPAVYLDQSLNLLGWLAAQSR